MRPEFAQHGFAVLVADEFERLLQGDGKQGVHGLHIGEHAAHFHIGSKTAQARMHGLSRLGVDSDFPRQGQQAQGIVEVDGGRIRLLAQADPLGLFVVLLLTQLQIGAEGSHQGIDVLPRPGMFADRLPAFILLLDERQGLFRRQFVDQQVHGNGSPLVVHTGNFDRNIIPADPQHDGIPGGRIFPDPNPGEFDIFHLPGNGRFQTFAVLAIATAEKTIQKFDEIDFTPGDAVQILLHARRELDIHVAIEMAAQQVGHGNADIRRQQGPALLDHIFPGLNGADHRGVGGGTANAFLLQLLDEGRLGKTRRRLRFVPQGLDILDLGRGIPAGTAEALTGLQIRQDGVLVRRSVHQKKAGEIHHGTVGAEQQIPPLARDGKIHGRLAQPGIGHLGRDGPHPDQAIDGQFVSIQIGFDVLGCAGQHRGANGFMRLLGTLGSGAVTTRPRGEFSAKACADNLLRLGQRFFTHGQGIGPHVGDQSLEVSRPHAHAFVEPLGNAHHPAGRHPEAAAGGLLQGRGRERRAGPLRRLFRDHRGYPPGNRGLGGGGQIGRLHLVKKHPLRGFLQKTGIGIEVTRPRQLHAVDLGQAGREVEVLGREQGFDIKEFRLMKRLAFLFALDHQPHGHTLDPTGRQARPDFLPQHRRKTVSEQAIQNPASLLRPDNLHVHIAGRFESRSDGPLGNLVKGYPLDGDLGLQDLQQMPADGFSLTVLIRGQQDLVSLLEQLLEFGDPLLGILGHHINGLILRVRIDAQTGPGFLLVFGRNFRGRAGQIPDMAITGGNFEFLAQKTGDGPGLGRGFDDDQLQKQNPSLKKRRPVPAGTG